MEKKIFLEVTTLEEARAFLASGAHGAQFDKIRPEVLKEYVSQLKAEFPEGTVLAAGGIRAENVTSFAEAGAHGLVYPPSGTADCPWQPPRFLLL